MEKRVSISSGDLSRHWSYCNLDSDSCTVQNAYTCASRLRNEILCWKMSKDCRLFKSMFEILPVDEVISGGSSGTSLLRPTADTASCRTEHSLT